MATLYIRNVPDELYKRFKRMAEAHNRTVNAQIIALIQAAVDEEEVRRHQAALLETMRRDLWAPAPNSPGIVDTLHESREEREAVTQTHSNPLR